MGPGLVKALVAVLVLVAAGCSTGDAEACKQALGTWAATPGADLSQVKQGACAGLDPAEVDRLSSEALLQHMQAETSKEQAND